MSPSVSRSRANAPNRVPSARPRNGSGPLRTPGVPPPRTANDETPRYAPTSKRRSAWYAYVLSLRKSWGRGRGRSGNGVARAGRSCLSGEAERDDGRASVNPDLFVMPMISIRKVVVESCRRLGSSAEVRSNVAGEHAYQHFMIISSPRGVSGRAVRLRVASEGSMA